MRPLKTTIYWFWQCILSIAFSPTLGFVYVVMSAGADILDSFITIFLKSLFCFLCLGVVLMLVLYVNVLLKELRRQCDISEHMDVVLEISDKIPFIVLGILVNTANSNYHPAWLQPILVLSPLISGIVSCAFFLFVKYHATPKLIAILSSKKEE